MTADSKEDYLNEVSAFIADNPTLSHVELLACDIPGNFFSKLYPIDQLKSLAREGFMIPRAMFVLSTVSESMSDAVGLGGEDGDPDTGVEIAPGTLARVSWGEKPRAQAVFTAKPSSVPVDPRLALRSILNRYKEKGLTPVAAFELEYTYFQGGREKGDPLHTAINPLTGQSDTATMLSAERLDGFERIIEETISHCAEQGISTTTICAEYGAGQFEINFPHYDDALMAADHAQLFRRAVKSVARRHGKQASFMAKPDINQPGNGQHLHVSVLNAAGENIFSAGDKPSQNLMHAIGGLQAAASEAMLFWCPNVNSYRRFEPENCVPTGATWAHEHRHVGFRIPNALGDAWRIENRIPGADANCYLTLATTLAGILHGIENEIPPSDEAQGAPDMDASLLPLTIRDAITATRRFEVLPNYLDKDFLELFVRHREGELSSFENVITSRELDWYL